MKKKRSQLEELINGPLEEWAKEQKKKKKPAKKSGTVPKDAVVDETCKELSSRFRIF